VVNKISFYFKVILLEKNCISYNTIFHGHAKSLNSDNKDGLEDNLKAQFLCKSSVKIMRSVP
jgi:hypothetical protein